MNPIIAEFISTEDLRTITECPETVILKQRGINLVFNTYGENMTLVLFEIFPYFQITIKDSVYTIMECFSFLKEILLCRENNVSSEKENVGIEAWSLPLGT